jgi:3-oxoacyl-[acyl-carrier-protein] synthase-3
MKASPPKGEAMPPAAVSIGYLGYGRWVPGQTLTNADLEQLVSTSDAWIQRRTGIRERRILGPEETILGMAVAAARQAMASAGIDAGQIGDIRVAVNTWLRFPSLATQLQREIGAETASAADVSAGCAGFIYAVEEAHNKIYVEQVLHDRKLHALVVGVDALSHITDWTDRGTCVVLGDGAGAVVMGSVAAGGIEAIHTHADGRYGDLLYSDPVLECQSDGNRTFTHREVGVRPYLHMDGPRVFPVAVKTMVNDVLAVMAKYNRTRKPRIGLDQIGYLFPHQANIRIIEAVVKKLGLPMARVYTDGIARYGNTSTASIPIGYCETWGTRNGDSAAPFEIDVAFGAGFASGAILRRTVAGEASHAAAAGGAGRSGDP